MAVSIGNVFYNHLKTDTDMISAFGSSIYYIENDNESKAPYATTYLSDDPRDRSFLCATDQGNATFECDNFAKTAPEGDTDRSAFIKAVRKLEGTTVDSFNIWRVEIINVIDRSNTINGLMQFSFSAVVYWKS
ncbi:MAG: hypothetical protein GY797_36965 [Deltaproteobacteria bacterium]|nr:hypothetical protein [Deltaproteobacteria bacterium]